jgi:hypothetical protein
VRTGRRGITALVVLVSACKGAHPTPASPEASLPPVAPLADAAPRAPGPVASFFSIADAACGAAPPEPDTARTMPYDCSGLSSEADPRPSVPLGLVALARVTATSPSIAASHFGVRDYRATLESGMALGEQLDPHELRDLERVVAQNGALILASVLHPGDADKEPSSHAATARALSLASKLALPAATLDALGAEPLAGLDRWLGPRGTWCEEDLSKAPGFHDSVFQRLLVFRAVRAGDLRAIFGQLVAVDTKGQAHLTPLVFHVELARGHGGAARGCVLDLDPRALRAGSPAGLVARDPKDLLPSHFAEPGTGKCQGCHTPGRSFTGSGDPIVELTGEAAASELRSSTAKGLAAATDRLAHLREPVAP